jgi:hypothetical protein
MEISRSKAQLCIFILSIPSLLTGQTVVNGGRVQIGSWDASGAVYTIPAQRGITAQLPATCTIGQQYFATDAAAGQNIYYCTATNTWTQQQQMFLQTGAGAVTRTVTAKLQDVVHVKDFGAKGNGVTDDSAAFIAALASGAGEVRADAGTYVVNSVITLAKGQKIHFGVGTHTIGGIRFTDSTTDQTGTGNIECAGSGQTTLMLKNGANLDVISQTNFAALTGTNSQYGLYRGQISGCTIDGNKTNQTGTSYGIRLYGHGLQMTDVMVRNAYSDGIYTEWGVDSTFATPQNDLEGYFVDIRSLFNQGNGWTFRGPHDSDFVNVVLYQNGGWGIQVQTSSTYNGNGHLHAINAFMNTLGGIYSNSSLDGSQIAATTNTGWGMLIDTNAGSHNFSASQFAGPVGVEVRAPSQIISGNIVNTTTAGLRLNGGSGNFNLQMFNNTGYQVDFENEVGPSVIFADSANPVPGTMFHGTPSQLDFIFLDFGGSASNRYISLPVQTVHVAGWSPQFPQSNATLAVVGDNTQTGTIYASTFSGALSGNVTGNVTGNLTGNVTGSLSGNASGFTGTLSGDVTGTQAATVVSGIQGRSVASTAPTTGQALTWSGSQWQPGSAGFTGTFSGDVTGTQTATVVSGIQGRSVASTAPTTGQALMWSGSQWQPGSAGSSSSFAYAHPLYGWGTDGTTLTYQSVVAANQINATIFEMPLGMTFTKIVFRINAATAGAHVAFSIWDSTGSTTKYADTGSISAASTGVITATVSSTTLAAGTYMIEWTSDNTAVQVNAFAVGATLPTYYPTGSWGTCGTTSNFSGTIFPTGCSTGFTQTAVDNPYVILEP